MDAAKIFQFFRDNKDLLGLIFAGSGFFGLLNNFYRASRDRRDELRWKRANESKQLIDLIHKHEKARPALTILDWVNITRPGFHNEVVARNTGTKESLTYQQVLDALGKNIVDADDDDQILIDYFDWLFYFVDRVEQNINSKLFDFNDVKYIFLPYFIKITEDSKTTEIYLSFMKTKMYYLAVTFWKRYLHDSEIRNIVQRNEPGYKFPEETLFSAAVPAHLHRHPIRKLGIRSSQFSTSKPN